MLNKGFLTNRNTITISKRRFWWAVFVGIGASFSIYTLFLLMRLTFRSFDFGFANYALIVDAPERYWQNFYFALVSLVLGNALFISEIFRSPIHTNLPKYKRSQILNNQIFLGFSFYHWFFKLFFLIGCFSAYMLDLGILSEIKFLLILPTIVIFLESWKSIVRYYGKVSKLFFLNLTTIVLLAFVFAGTSVFQIETINELLEQNNFFVDLPESDYVDQEIFRNYRRDEDVKIFVDNGKVKYTFQYENFENLKDLQNHKFPERFIMDRYPVVNILAPKNIAIEEIEKIQKFFIERNQNRFKYLISIPGIDGRFSDVGIYDIRNFSDLQRVKDNLQIPPPPIMQVETNNVKPIYIGRIICFNNDEVTKAELIEKLIENFDKEDVLNYVYDNDISYQKYVDVLSAHKKAIEDLRANDQRVFLNPDYRFHPQGDEEYMAELKRLRGKYPFKKLNNYSTD